MNDLINSFSIPYHMMKMKYAELDKSLSSLQKIQENDKINVFINFEAVMNNLSGTQDLDRKILINEKEFTIVMVSNILNLAAHYKRFFVENGLQTRVFIYMTDYSTDSYKQYMYNEDYRSYFQMKYNCNPKYLDMKRLLTESIIPMVKRIVEFIPNVHFITAKNIESSLVPMIISKNQPGYKNIIITRDEVDTQYGFEKDYVCYYFKRSQLYSSINYTLRGYLRDIIKKQKDDYQTEINFYSNKSFYILLLCCLGEKYRSVEPIYKVGSSTLIKYINDGLNEQKITPTTTSIELLKEIFSEDIQKEVYNNFNCLSLDDMYDLLSEEDIFSITSQMVDKSDNNSLITLNRQVFMNHPLMLQELTM